MIFQKKDVVVERFALAFNFLNTMDADMYFETKTQYYGSLKWKKLWISQAVLFLWVEFITLQLSFNYWWKFHFWSKLLWTVIIISGNTSLNGVSGCVLFTYANQANPRGCFLLVTNINIFMNSGSFFRIASVFPFKIC